MFLAQAQTQGGKTEGMLCYVGKRRRVRQAQKSPHGVNREGFSYLTLAQRR